MNLRYTIGALLTLPLLPLMHYQGKQIRASVPKLPEATGTSGVAGAEFPRGIQFLTVGESTIAGVGVDTHREGFTGTLARELSERLAARVDWKVYAKSGYTARRVAYKLVPKIDEAHADLIVVGLGGNDAFKLNSPSRWRKGICTLVGQLRLKFASTPIVFANMPPIRDFPAFTPLIKRTVGSLVEMLGDELENWVRDQQGVYYYSRRISLPDWIERLKVDAQPEDFFSDGVHPSRLTYQVWAKDLCQFIVEQSEIKDHLVKPS